MDIDIIPAAVTPPSLAAIDSVETSSVRPSCVKLTGTYTTWTLCDVTRQYGTVQNLRYSEAVELVKPVPFKGETGKGQQRALVQNHVRKIKREMRNGNFTPTPVSAALEDRHLAGLTLNPDGTFSLVVKSQDPLLHTDGGHRFEALGQLIEELEAAAEKAKTDEERENLTRWAEQAKVVPCTVTVYFGGNPQQDFVNLQAGRTVDTSHMKALTLHAKDGKPEMGLAFEVATTLNKDKTSPFYNEVRFDSRGNRRLPIATLTATGGSDIGTSLVGVAKLGISRGKSAKFLAAALTDAYVALKESSDADGEDGALEEGKVMTPVVNHGTKGASTMLVGVGLCLAYRLISLGKEKADQSDLDRLVAVVGRTLNVATKGNFSGSVKRKLLGRFAKEFFADTTETRHQGVPIPLLKTLSCSTFDTLPLRKGAPATKGRGR